MLRTDLLSIVRSLNTVFTATGSCHTSYVDCLLARSGCILTSMVTKIQLRNSTSFWLLLQEYITMHGPVNVKFGNIPMGSHSIDGVEEEIH